MRGREAEILGAALQLSERIFMAALGPDSQPVAASRIVLEPLEVLYDIADVLRQAETRLKEAGHHGGR